MEAPDWLIIIHPFARVRVEQYSRNVYRTQGVTVLVGYVVMVAQQESAIDRVTQDPAAAARTLRILL